MLQRVKIPGCQLPRLYIAENMADVRQARDAGIPYVSWKAGMDEFIRTLLRPAIEQLFPGINWNKVLGRPRKLASEVIIVQGDGDEEFEFDGELVDFDADAMLEAQLEHEPSACDEPDDDDWHGRLVDVAESKRSCDGGGGDYESFNEERISVYDWIGDATSSVNIEVLQQLKMLPKFVGDITDNIKLNLSDRVYWTEGYTKKLGIPLGNFKSRGILPNLIILDISHSIPEGIASTMLTLIDTLRNQCNADLIITSARSGYYPAGSELPDPQTLRDYYGRSNEAREFYSILSKYIFGKEWGNVISFGDYDCPSYWGKLPEEHANTVIHTVWNYHTNADSFTGYAEWTKLFDPDEVHYDNTWCTFMRR